MPITIVLTGGGSGGHIAPLLSLAHAVKKTKPDCRVVYIGLLGETVSGLKSGYGVFDRTDFIRSGKFRRYHGESWVARLLDYKTWLLNIRDFFRVVAGTFSAYKLLGEIQPDLVFSKGSFVAVPVGVAAKLRGISIITHDSDATAGLANRIVGRWAVANAVGAKEGTYPYPKQRIVFTGIPLDERIKPVDYELQNKYKAGLKTSPSSKLLLVAGGGLGARDLNLAMASITGDLLAPRSDWQIIHLSGSGQEADTKKAYAEQYPGSSNVKVIGFTDKFYAFVGAADLIVSRAGATALAEFALSRKACVLVPAPHLAGGHQLKNARNLESADAAAVVSLENGVQQLHETVSKLMDDTERRQKLADNLHRQTVPDAADNLAKLLVERVELKRQRTNK